MRDRRTTPKKARSKYGAVKTTVDGITFDSAKEATRYGELRALERAGEISGLIRQWKRPLEVADKNGRSICIGFYLPDFAYFEREGGEVVEDVKGYRTEMYRWKKKHFEAQYGITIREV